MVNWAYILVIAPIALVCLALLWADIKGYPVGVPDKKKDYVDKDWVELHGVINSRGREDVYRK